MISSFLDLSLNILEINKQPAQSTSDYKKIIKDLKGDALIKTSRGYFLLKNQ